MRRVPRRTRAASSVAAVTAALLVSAFPGAYTRPADAAPSPVGLPVMPSTLASGRSCTGASPTQAHARPWAASALSLSQVRALTQGAGVTVGVVDTGVATAVPALAGRVTALGDAGHDCVGHGTFAAGLIAGADGATGGGLAPQARILAVRGTDKAGVASPHTVATGIRTAVKRGARVVYVGAALTTGRDELTAAVAYATRADVLVVAPAVPDAVPAATVPGAVATPTPPRPRFPAFVAEVVAVEDYGPDGSRPKDAPPVFAADLAAPGDAMVSVGPKGTGHYIGSGSSLAAACVAGTAALVRAYQPRLTAAQVAKRLITSAYPASAPILDPYAAVAAVPFTTATAPPAPAAVHLPRRASGAPRSRALTVAAVAGGLVALVAAGAAVIPLGRARRWRPAGRDDG